MDMTLAELERLATVRRLCTSGDARDIRQRADLSLREIAEASQVHLSTIHKWETGQRAPRGKAALRYLTTIELVARVAA
jgi:DNA-binding transcriptional regulator YiaG